MRPPARLPLAMLVAVLAVELVDELVDGVGRAAVPLIRTELRLSYSQIGLLLGVPGFVGSFIEPFLGVAGDVWRRRVLVMGGGAAFVLALSLTAGSRTFAVLLASFVLFYPASGAFVSLSQASLMDAEPGRREQNMARWTVSGSVGNVIGPIAVVGAIAAGGGWRLAYGALAVLAAIAVAVMSRFPFSPPHPEMPSSILRGLADAVRALRRFEVLRWLALLELSDLMLDVLTGFMALYLVDVGGLTAAQAAAVIGAHSASALVGELAVVGLLERIRGLDFVRWSVVLTALAYPALLLTASPAAKVVIAVVLGFTTAGWYSILKAQLYSAMPGRSGTVMAVGNITGLLGSAVPVGLGAVAQSFGLRTAMWLLLAGPLALAAGLPRRRSD
jgi:FSR family fosmidomycin resistance protein-like MFS transporter